MGVEALHRALARQSLGHLGNERVFMKLDQPEMAPGAPNLGLPGFRKVMDVAAQLQAAGFASGTQGATPAGTTTTTRSARTRRATRPEHSDPVMGS